MSSNLSQVLDVTSTCITNLSSIYRKLLTGNKNEESDEAKKIREMIKVILQKYTDLIDPLVSVKAQKLFDKQVINKKFDLHKYRWKDKKYLEIEGKKSFHYEHVVPISVLTYNCLKAENKDETKKVINTAVTAWVTIEENNLLDEGLNRKMYIEKGKANNIENPFSRYEQKGIKLIINMKENIRLIKKHIRYGICPEGMLEMFAISGDKDIVKKHIIEEVKKDLALATRLFKSIELETKYVTVSDLQSMYDEGVTPNSKSGKGLLVIDDLRQLLSISNYERLLIGLMRNTSNTSTGWHIVLLVDDLKESEYVAQLRYFINKNLLRFIDEL